MNPLIHLLFILPAWLAFGLCRNRHADLFLTVGGILFLALYAPAAAIWIALTAAEAAVITIALFDRERSGNLRQYLPYVVLLNLLFVDLHPDILLVSVETLAISFSTIRIFMTSKQLLAMRKGFAPAEVRWIFVAAFYLPALIVGPVFSGTELRSQKTKDARPDLSARTFRFLLAGTVCVMLINPALLSLARIVPDSIGAPLHTIVTMPVYFLVLFTGFYGQSLIAEYSSKLFGRTLPYNFDRPWRAQNIREFWQRWHRSMANFVMQYIFLPLNMRGVNARLATVSAFVFMGLWHNLSAGYFVWGLSHGLLLAFWPRGVENRALKLLERAITWIAVLGLSYVANYSWLA